MVGSKTVCAQSRLIGAWDAPVRHCVMGPYAGPARFDGLVRRLASCPGSGREVERMLNRSAQER